MNIVFKPTEAKKMGDYGRKRKIEEMYQLELCCIYMHTNVKRKVPGSVSLKM
jgi:hypothetical protein